MISLATRWLLGLALCTAVVTAFADKNTSLEDELLLKTAYVYNFAKFTRWPARSFNQATAPIHLCTMGNNPLVDELEQLQGKPIKGHPVVVSRIESAETARNCHLLYIADSEKASYPSILREIKNSPVLSVSEISYFARNGGIIQFYRKRGQTRLVINLTAAHHAGLEISSRLLILAKIIGGSNS